MDNHFIVRCLLAGAVILLFRYEIVPHITSTAGYQLCSGGLFEFRFCEEK